MTDEKAGVYNDAFTPAGSWKLVEPAIQVTHADEVTLIFKTYFRQMVVEQWTVKINGKKKPIRLQIYTSAHLYFMAWPMMIVSCITMVVGEAK